MEDNKYENVIARYTAEQLGYEQAIVENEAKTVYNKQKAIKEEWQKRLRERE